jgi:hypothetical protein
VLRERLSHAGGALAGTVVALVRRGDEAEAAMPERDEMLRQRARRRAVVEADAGVPVHPVDTPGQHVRPRELVEEREELRIVVEADEDDRVDAALEKPRRDPHLGREIVVMRREDERIAALVEGALERARRPCVESVVEGRDDGAHRVGALRAESARRAVRHVAQLANRLLHARQRPGLEPGGKVEGARDGGGRDGGAARHVPEARSRPPLLHGAS